MNPIRSAFALLRRLRDNRRGNVLIIMGFATIPLTFATGMTIDYSQAARLQTKLDTAADAAALAAVTLPTAPKAKVPTVSWEGSDGSPMKSGSLTTTSVAWLAPAASEQSASTAARTAMFKGRC